MPALEVTDGQGGLIIRNIGKSYKKRPVLRDVSLELHRGEVVALLGPNGAGKNHLFLLNCWLSEPRCGHSYGRWG